MVSSQTSAARYDAFVRKYDLDGSELWTRQFGSSSSTFATGIAVDPTGVYIAGSTDEALPGQTSAGGRDAFVGKYDLDGIQLWTRQFGSSSSDLAFGIAVDSTGVYASGYIGGVFPGRTTTPNAVRGNSGLGNTNTFVRKYDLDGTELWTHQFRSLFSSTDWKNAIAIDSSWAYVAGWTYGMPSGSGGPDGALPGQTSAGGRSDAFVVKLSATPPP